MSVLKLSGYQRMSQLTPSSSDQERYSRRLSDKIQAAFDHACDEGELEVAAELLETLEVVLLRTPPKPDRRETVVAPLLASHERLWHLRASGSNHFGRHAAPEAEMADAPGEKAGN
jgi:hypothetical protein